MYVIFVGFDFAKIVRAERFFTQSLGITPRFLLKENLIPTFVDLFVFYS